MEEWISLSEYMKRRKIGYNVALQLLYNKEVEYIKTEGGQYKIKVGGDSISKEMYEREKELRIKAETKLELLKKILNEEVIDGIN